MTPLLFTLNFGVFPLDQIANVGVNLSRYLKLVRCQIIFEVNSNKKKYLNVTDGRMDRRTTYCGITALYIASCGKNCSSLLVALPDSMHADNEVKVDS